MLGKTGYNDSVGMSCVCMFAICVKSVVARKSGGKAVVELAFRRVGRHCINVDIDAISLYQCLGRHCINVDCRYKQTLLSAAPLISVSDAVLYDFLYVNPI